MQEIILLLQNLGIGVLAGAVYAVIGYLTQSEPFNVKKFLTTVLTASASALGLSLTGFTISPYTAGIGPIAITVFIQKFIREIQNRLG